MHDSARRYSARRARDSRSRYTRHSEAREDTMAGSKSERLRGKVARSRWGERDQIGRLNLMSEASRQAVLGRLDPSRTFDLGVEYRIGMPSWTKWGDPPYQIWMTHTPGGT